ncbi:MAG: hypothetical protein WC399_02140 [Bacilli bacterium]|jgi:hypothetical protein
MSLPVKKLSTFLVSLAMVGGVALSVGIPNQNTQYQIQASQTLTHRRIYLYVKPADWGDVRIHYWGTGVGNNYNEAPLMHYIDDYWNGLYYYDVEYATTGFLIKNAYAGDGTNKTPDILMSSLFEAGGNYKVQEIWGTGGNGSAGIFAQDTLPASAEEVANILAEINTCSNNDASGYNSWPQLNDLFIVPNSLRESTQTVPDKFGSDPTIKQKCDAIEKFYTDGFVSY